MRLAKSLHALIFGTPSLCAARAANHARRLIAKRLFLYYFRKSPGPQPREIALPRSMWSMNAGYGNGVHWCIRDAHSCLSRTTNKRPTSTIVDRSAEFIHRLRCKSESPRRGVC